MGSDNNRRADAASEVKLHISAGDGLRASSLALIRALEAKDEGTRDHSVRVAFLAKRIAAALGVWRAMDHVSIYFGALLHDIGKLHTPDSILLKAGTHTDAERDEMRAHAKQGAELLDELGVERSIRSIVAQHHERYDGAGYPVGLKGTQIALGARIVAVADAYDCITSARPYKVAQSHETAVQRITAARGSQFDPCVVDAFLSRFD
jgi:putative nucleotidyltransferase with HDIG domain